MKIRLLFCLLAFAMPRLLPGAPVLPEVAPRADSRLPVVGRYLNSGGDLYLAMDSGEWTKELDMALARLQGFFETTLAEEKREGMDLLFHFVHSFLRDSGVRDLGGFGASSVALAEDLHHNRLFLQHPAGGPRGFLWDALTGENLPLALLQRLPANTAFARWGIVRPLPVWQWLNNAVKESGNEEFVAGFQEALADLAESGIDLERCVASLKGGVGFVATADPERSSKLPLGRDRVLEMPALAGALVAEVTDDTLFDLIGKMLADRGKEFERVERNGVRALLLQEERIEDLGFSFRVTVARFEDLLVVSTSDVLVETLAAKRGGLTETPHFRRCQQSMPQEGFAFLYLSPVASRVACDAIVKLAADEAPEAAGVVAAWYAPMRDLSSWSVTLRTPDGVAVVANQSAGAAQLLLTHGPAAHLPILGGAMIPALAGAREKAQLANDQSNLKQLGLGLIMCSMDHDGKFPDDLGATMDYVNDGKVYVCPASKTIPPTTAEEIRAGRCDYLYFGKGRTEADMVRVHEIPIACTKPGLLKGGQIHVLFADGHVEWREQVPESIRKLTEAQTAPK